jgi:hypothetical protein
MKLPALLLLAVMSPAMAVPAYAPVITGNFNCRDKNYKAVKMEVKQHPDKPNKIMLNWAGKDRILHWVETDTGALRYEGAESKITYVQIPGHTVVLDDTTMRPILTDCVKRK